jgi:hypothetical protein
VKADWGDAPHSSGEQRSFTNGRVIVAGGKGRRGKQKRLFANLRELAGEGEKGSQREDIANVFKDVQNRRVGGYLLCEMRDAAGDAGEFYTPRPMVRFMVQVSDPRLGETVNRPCFRGGSNPREWSHEEVTEVFTRSSRARCSHGV